jgi:uncharacterized protein (DUF305 family)
VNRRTYAIAAVVIVLAAGGVALGLRAAGAEPEAAPTPTATSSPVPVIVPGRPGESASVVPSDQLAAPDGSRYNSLDAWYVRMMIPHHGQALEMAALAPSRARSPLVRAVAERITVAQGPEIDVFRAWLAARGLSEQDDDKGHDHGAMRGMLPPEAMRALAGLTGDAFDKVFVDMMVVHHEGAIAMCRDVLKVGVDERLHELATGIAAEQSAEISRLRELVAR